MLWKRALCCLLLANPIKSLQRFTIISRRTYLQMSTLETTPAVQTSSVYDIEEQNGKVTRKVIPYIQEFETYAKGRWLGRSLVEVLTKEFGGHPEIYWKNAIKNGHVRINGKVTKEEYKLKNSDKLLHRTHRHEPPVFGKIEYVGETENLFAVCKPPSMPMHPSGAYRHNSLEFILKNDPIIENQPSFHLVHRLDRVTSGLVVLAKNKVIAAKISQEIRDKSTKKEYLARVKGKFPQRLHELKKLNAIAYSKYVEDGDESEGSALTKKRKLDNITSLSDKAKETYSFKELCKENAVGYYESADEHGNKEYWVDCPLGVVSHRDGVHACDPNGKPSLSVFKVLGYCEESDTSLVHCTPYTGRTHQLRLHLELAGNSIANDPCYGGELFFGDMERKQKAIDAIKEMKKLGVHPLSKVPHIEGVSFSDFPTDDNASTLASEISEQGEDESNEAFLKRTCKYCRSDGIASKLEHLIHCDGIWLHAFRYSGDGWSFKAPLPDWTNVFNVKL